MKLIALLLASTEATQLASEASWNNGQYVPWTPPANASWNTGAYVPWTPEDNTATANTGAWVDDSHLYDWGQWNNNSETEVEVTEEDPAAAIEQFNDIWDNSPAAGSFVVNTPDYTGGEWDPSATDITTTGEDAALTQDELDILNSFVDTNWQNNQPWINVDTDADANAEATAFPNAPEDDFINTSWQNDMPWLNAHPTDATSAEEAVTAGDVEPTTEDFEAMFDQIDINDFDWESVTEDESDFQNVDEEEEVCENTDNGITDDWGDDCEDYAVYTEWCGLYDNGRFKSMEMCCACKEIDGTNPYASDDTCEDNLDVEDVYGDDCS